MASPGLVSSPEALDQLRTRVELGELPLAAAEQRAAALPNLSSDLDYVEGFARGVLARSAVDPLAATPPARLLAAALGSPTPPVDGERAWTVANLAWGTVASRALEIAPDARNLTHADQRAERVRRYWDGQRVGHPDAIQARVVIGELHLRPYRTSVERGYAELTAPEWVARLLPVVDQRAGFEIMSGSIEYPSNARRPPPWKQAAGRAEATLREALALAGQTAGAGIAAILARSLAARLQDEDDPAIDPAEIATLAAVALRAAQGLERASLICLLTRLGASGGSEELVELARQVDLEDEVVRHGLLPALRHALEITPSLVEVAAPIALMLTARLEPFVAASRDEWLMTALWAGRAAALERRLRERQRPRWRRPPLTEEQKLFLDGREQLHRGRNEDATALLRRLVAGKGEMEQRNHATLVWSWIDEQMRIALQATPERRLRLLPDVMLAQLELGMRRWPPLLLNTFAHDVRDGTTDPASFLDFLRIVPPRMERTFRDLTQELMRDAAIFLVPRLLASEAHTELVELLQLLHGARFAATVHDGARISVDTDDEELGARFARIRALQVQARRPVGESGTTSDLTPGVGDEPAVRELILSSYVTSSEFSTEDSPRAAIANLQTRVDAILDDRLLAGASDRVDALTVDQIRSAVGPRSALLLFHLGRKDPPHGPPHVVTVLIHNGAVVAAEAVSPYSHGDTDFWNSPDGRLWVTSPLAEMLALLRRHLQDYPGPDIMSETAEEHFRAIGGIDMHLGVGVRAELERLRASGLEHVCVVPQGAYRTFPVHLLGAPDQCLWDEVAVTSLPHASLLSPSRGAVQRPGRSTAVAAFGLSYARLERLDPSHPPVDTAPQARQVAETFGSEPILDGAVTREAFLRALQSAEFVHLAAHGEMNFGAPAFQSLHLAPSGPQDDGRFYAYETMRLDLSGLKLVTLSACESALGRFDFGDNPRGLVANLLRAGAHTVVGTLWPVKASVAELFFPQLYRRLRDGDRVLDAFVNAVTATRRRYPELRDWGAFQLIGDWQWRRGGQQ